MRRGRRHLPRGDRAGARTRPRVNHMADSVECPSWPYPQQWGNGKEWIGSDGSGLDRTGGERIGMACHTILIGGMALPQAMGKWIGK